MKKFTPKSNLLFVPFAVAAIAIVTWAVYSATVRHDDNEPDAPSMVSRGSSAQSSEGGYSEKTSDTGAGDNGVQNVGVGDSVEIVVRDAQGRFR